MPRRGPRPDSELWLTTDAPAELDILEQRGSPPLVEPVTYQKIAPEARQAGFEHGHRLDALQAAPVSADAVLAIPKRPEKEDVVVQDVREPAVLHLQLDAADARIARIGLEGTLKLL